MPDRVIAIDVGGTSLKGAVVDRRGQLLFQSRRPTGAQRGSDAVLAAILDFASDLVGEHASTAAVGITTPGLVDERAGVVLAAANLHWRDVPIRQLAHHRLGLPVAVMHDVRAAALAEGLMGAAQGRDDYLMVTLGTGIGAAVVIGGRPYTGAHGIGGELGHVAVQPRGPLCGCGRPGCLEALASAGHVATHYRTMTGDRELVDAEQVAARAAAGDEIAHLVWDTAIDALALAMANYCALLDPELIVVGGGMATAGQRLFAPLQRRLVAHLRFGQPPPVVAAALGADAGRRGAAIAAWRLGGIDEADLSAWAA